MKVRINGVESTWLSRSRDSPSLPPLPHPVQFRRDPRVIHSVYAVSAVTLRIRWGASSSSYPKVEVKVREHAEHVDVWLTEMVPFGVGMEGDLDVWFADVVLHEALSGRDVVDRHAGRTFPSATIDEWSDTQYEHLIHIVEWDRDDPPA